MAGLLSNEFRAGRATCRRAGSPLNCSISECIKIAPRALTKSEVGSGNLLVVADVLDENSLTGTVEAEDTDGVALGELDVEEPKSASELTAM